MPLDVMKITTAVRQANPVGLTQELVRIPSHSGLPRREERVAQHLADFCRDYNLDVALYEVQSGRPNVMVVLDSGKLGPHLLLCGHLDTVPPSPGMGDSAFSGDLVKGRIVGRGSVDMKGPLAAMAAALAGLKTLDALKHGSVTLAAVTDEEERSAGIEYLITSGFRADAAVVGEPTANRVAVGHRGLEWIEVRFRGRGCHSGASHQGINAISAAAHFGWLVENELRPRLAGRVHPLLGPSTVNLGRIEGGEQPSTVAADCRLQLDRRWLPGETRESVYRQLQEIAGKVSCEFPGILVEVHEMESSRLSMIHGPLHTPVDSPIVQLMLQVLQDVTGVSDAVTAFSAWTDGALLSREAGIETIVMGPGDLSLAHSPRESISGEEVEAAAVVYAALALRFCQGEAHPHE